MSKWGKVLHPYREHNSNVPTNNQTMRSENDMRSPFQKDFDTICNSSSFRRLQGKAQVFPLERGDFSRTRLTHSIETMSIAESIGESIVNIILQKEENLNDDEIKLIEAIPTILKSAALIHDFGNPPFGHISEGIISKWFDENLSKLYFKDDKLFYDDRGHDTRESIENILSDYQNDDLLKFDGNAQTLRIITHLQNPILNTGMNLTYPVMATIIKYPCVPRSNKDSNGNVQNKKDYFFTEEKIYTDIQNKLELNHTRHPLTYLLEASDDIAYLTADIEDASRKGLITLDALTQELQARSPMTEEEYIIFLNEKLDECKKNIVSKLSVTDGNCISYISEKLDECKTNFKMKLTTSERNCYIEYMTETLEKYKTDFKSKIDALQVKEQLFSKNEKDLKNSDINSNARRIDHVLNNLKQDLKSKLISESTIIVYALECLNEYKKTLRRNYHFKSWNSHYSSIIFRQFRAQIKGKMISEVIKAFEKNYDVILNGTYTGELLKESNLLPIKEVFSSLLVKNVYYSQDIIKQKIEACKIIDNLLSNYILSIFNYNKKANAHADDIASLIYNTLSVDYCEVCKKAITKFKNDTEKNKSLSKDEKAKRIKTQETYYKLLLAIDNIVGMTDTYAYDVYHLLNAI